MIQTSVATPTIEKSRKISIPVNGTETWLFEPDYEQIITEDDTPVDNMPSEKQQRLLTEPLYSAKDKLGIEWPFLAAANVGLYAIDDSGIVPDVLLSLGVTVADDWREKHHRSYIVREFGKLPELVIEIVSNKKGKEDSDKKNHYASIGITYYVIYDPMKKLGNEILRIYALDEQSLSYRRLWKPWFPRFKLGLMLWKGEFEGKKDEWLRWCDENGMLPTGNERAEYEQYQKELAQQRAEHEQHQKELAQQRAEHEQHQKELAQQRAERLIAQLQALGIEPET
ncbi:Uma2 family endonuclease [Anaerolineales bacterium HSG24]|nr:Uma2 family endonuclease [Anaerolineales bacterium HSG24]